jgi:3-phosphoshikimate 1-carboxyvinyltransferase
VTTFVAGPCAGGLRGRVRVPGDKSVSHRALLLAARAAGRSRLSGLSSGEDVLCTLGAIGQFGAAVSRDSEGALIVAGGPERLREPEAPVDVGNSGTAIRLLAGWATGVDGLAVLAGDASIARRPMGRVTEPLRLMGARIDGRHEGRLPPLVVRGGGLTGIDYRLPVPSAQVKGALLLAGLTAHGETTVREDVPTRMHTEEMLARCGAEVIITPGAVTVRPGPLEPLDLEVPGDPSQAAFWVVAACVTPGSDLTVQHIYVGPGRAGFLDVLTRMGADLQILDKDGASSTATIRARYGPLLATFVGGEEVPALIDEIPALAVAAAYAAGSTTFTDAAELRVKESDRIATMVTALRAIGAGAEERPDGLVVQGSEGRPLRGGLIDSAGDHRVAMAMAAAAPAASAPVTVSGWEAVATSYPGFEEEYRTCGS